MDKFYFTQEERALMHRVIEKGLLQRPGRDAPQWWVARLALAKSLQMQGSPEESDFAPPPNVKGGSELHLDQIAGKGKGIEDYTETFKLLLSTRHDIDLFEDNSKFEEMLHRHIRRGLREIRISWRENFDFFDYLYQDLFYEGVDESVDRSGGVGIADESVASALKTIGVSAEIEERLEGLRLSRFRLILSGVEDYDKLRRSIEDINFILGLSANSLSVELGGGERRIIVDIPRPMRTWRFMSWNRAKEALEDSNLNLPICVSSDVLGNPIVFDLASAPHLMIGGTTGSGKSISIHALLLSLLIQAQRPKIVLIDPKGVELVNYEKVSRAGGGRVITDMSESREVLLELVETMNERQETYKSIGARDIDEALKKGIDGRRIVVVVDELADLVLGNPEAVNPLVRLAQKARAFGIHLVLATQRPEAATFPGLLRSNVPSRIALTVQKNSESRIILDEGGAENLLMRGDMLMRMVGQKTIRAHGISVENADIEETLRADA